MNTAALQNRRVWLIGGAFAAVFIAAIGWLFVIHPKMSAASDLRSQAASTVTQNMVLKGQVDKLAIQDAHIDTQRKRLAQALTRLPASAGLSEFTRTVSTAAKQKSVELTSITIGAQSAVAASTPVAPAAVDPSDTTSSTDSPAAAPTAPAVAAEFSIAVTLQTRGTVQNQIAYVRALQNGSRGLLVTSTQLTSGGATPATMTTQLDIFTAPIPAAQLAQINTLLHGK